MNTLIALVICTAQHYCVVAANSDGSITYYQSVESCHVMSDKLNRSPTYVADGRIASCASKQVPAWQPVD